MALINLDKQFFNIQPKMRWAIIVVAFTIITLLDFSTPPEYILAYLYVVPILVSASFLSPQVSKTLLIVAVIATLSDLFLPQNVLNNPSILVNRLLAALSIIISTYFMVRYIRHQAKVQEQEKLVSTERNLAQIREDFTATLTHDLKTPLLGEQKVLQHFLEGMSEIISPDDKEMLEALNRNKHRQLELVNNLLSVYRYDNLGVELKKELLDLDELIADILTEMQILANDRHIGLEYICRRLPPKVQGDMLQLKRVIANLLHNALNYTPAGGSIHVNLSEQSHYLLVEISDNGPGLAEEELENVFHRFYRAEGARGIVGTGLGLYLSRQLIQAHRGRLWAENIADGGCKFSFILPIENTPS